MFHHVFISSDKIVLNLHESENAADNLVQFFWGGTDLWNTLATLEQIWITMAIVEHQCIHLCYGLSKRLNFVQFILFKNSTNFDYWKLDTLHSLPILKNAYCPLILYLIDFGTTLSKQSFSSSCFWEVKPSFVHGKNNM